MWLFGKKSRCSICNAPVRPGKETPKPLIEWTARCHGCGKYFCPECLLKHHLAKHRHDLQDIDLDALTDARAWPPYVSLRISAVLVNAIEPLKEGKYPCPSCGHNTQYVTGSEGILR